MTLVIVVALFCAASSDDGQTESSGPSPLCHAQASLVLDIFQHTL